MVEKIVRTRFYYDSEKMEYVKLTWRQKGRSAMMLLATSFILSIIIIIILFNIPYFKTPRELSQERELNHIRHQFELVNDKMSQIEVVLENIENRDDEIYRVYFEVSSISKDQRKSGFGGINRYKYLEGFANSDLLIENAKRLDLLQKRLVVQSKSLDEITELAKNKKKFLSSIPAIQPINNENLRRIASGFGYRIDPFTKIKKMHKGIDFSAPRGTPVYATGDGKVIRADSRSSGYGKHVRVDHGCGYKSLYAHLNKYIVKRGQKIKRGQIIGYVGNTGRSQAPHLHYEVYKNRQNHVNPVNFYYGELTPSEFEEVLEIANRENQSFD